MQDLDNARSAPNPLPLSGVKVLDFSRLLPGPACTQILAELGAEVLRVEDASRSDGGDFLRVPPNASSAERAATYTQGKLYEAINRGKQSIALNLKHPEGVEIARILATRSDVVVEGFRPGVMNRLGLGHARLLAEHPSLVYCSISGYGQSGPWALRAGHDINYLAVTGVLEGNRDPSGRPILAHVQWADLASGALNATIAILAALLGARSTGRGRHLDIAMAQGLYGLQVSAIAGMNAAENKHVDSVPSMLTGAVAAYQVYATQDHRWLAVGALEPQFWARFCQVIGREDLLSLGLAEGAAGAQAIAEVSWVIASRTLSEWVTAFDGHDCCVTPVLSLAEAAHHGPYARDSEQIFPISLGDRALGPAPECGEDTFRTLASIGYDPCRIQQLAQEGAIGKPAGPMGTKNLERGGQV